MSRGVQTLRAAGRSPVRKHCGRQQHTGKSWSRRRGFLSTEDRKKKLGYRSFIPPYIRCCSLCYLNPSQYSEWFKLVQQPPALRRVCWQKSKCDYILTIQRRRCWQQILISVQIFLLNRFKLWEAHFWPTCSCFESFQTDFLQKQKTEMEILPKRFPPKLLNISLRFWFFSLQCSNRKFFSSPWAASSAGTSPFLTECRETFAAFDAISPTFFPLFPNPQRGFSVICIHWKCHFNYLELM